MVQPGDNTSECKLSIVIPVYNRELLIGRAITSCLNTSRNDIEVIVVDDASTDQTLDAIHVHADPRLKIVALERNAGVCAARGAGVERATGRWVAFLDSDDEFVPDCLGDLIACLEDIPEDIGGFSSRRKHVNYKWALTPVTIEKMGRLSLEDCCILNENNFSTNIDTFFCVRRHTFEKIAWPNSIAAENEYHFQFARSFGYFFSERIFYICHHDAHNQITKPTHYTIENDLSYAHSHMRTLETFGDFFKQYAPRFRQHLLRSIMVATSAAEGRARLLGALRTVGAFPLGPKLSILFAICMISPTFPFRLKNHAVWKYYKKIRAGQSGLRPD